MADARQQESRDDVAAVRRFNRFYTRQVGALDERLLASQFSLTEVRVLYELAHRDGVTASVLGKELAIDAGYLSRIVRRFARRGLVRRVPSRADGRQSILGLTAKGREVFAGLDAMASEEIDVMLAPLPPADRRRLVSSMQRIQRALEPGDAADREPYVLRPPQPGDLGWVIHRHGVLYADEYGWDERFEALVAGVIADYVKNHDPARERCWIAERDGEIVGSVFVVKKSATIAQLRLLYVEPMARGLGIGKRLVDECIRFAKRTRYRTLMLWTQRSLLAARHIYAAAGFTLVQEEQHESFGHSLVAEVWQLEL